MLLRLVETFSKALIDSFSERSGRVEAHHDHVVVVVLGASVTVGFLAFKHMMII